MRITNRMITSKYINSLNRLSSDLNKLNTQVATGRKFTKASENPSAATKAFEIRKDLTRLEAYSANIEHAQAFLTNTESSLTHIEELLQTASDRILYGMNGTQSKDERLIVVTELRNIQKQLFQELNSTASGTYLFGGSNTDDKPFSLNGAGNLVYNGYDLNSLALGSEEELKLKGDSLYLDVGLNVRLDSSGNIDRSTVFEYSITGISLVGNGYTEIDGRQVPNNIYNLIGKIADVFESDDYSFEEADRLYGHLSSVSENIIKNITETGSKTAYLDFLDDRLETQVFNLQQSQLSVEGADPARTIIEYEAQKFAYNAALQMGKEIIQPSIFDFMS